MSQPTCPVCCLEPNHTGPHCDCANEAPGYVYPKVTTRAYDQSRRPASRERQDG
jgi:hypothetical protein